MKHSWKECKLGDVIEILGGGTPKTNIPEYWNGNIPWLSVADFNSGNKYVYKTEKAITLKGLENSSTRLLNQGDIIISARGTVGALAVLREQMAFNQSCYGIREVSGISCQDYLYYLIKDSINNFQQIAHGGVFDTITRETFDQITINLPSLSEQRAIAVVLSSLDDKIDLLYRQNKTLESIAESLWRKMFMEDADLGWKNGTLSEFGRIVCGKTPSKNNSEYFGGHVPFIKIPDMHGNVFIFATEDSLTEKGKESQVKKTIPARSICVSCIATVGLVGMNTFDSQTNQQINTIIPHDDYLRYFLFLLMRSTTDDLYARASGGTATDNLNTGDFSRIEVSLPPGSLIKSFDVLVKDYFEKIFSNQIQIRTLSHLRDNLLPNLMSGEVKVRNFSASLTSCRLHDYF